MNWGHGKRPASCYNIHSFSCETPRHHYVPEKLAVISRIALVYHRNTAKSKQHTAKMLWLFKPIFRYAIGIGFTVPRILLFLGWLVRIYRFGSFWINVEFFLKRMIVSYIYPYIILPERTRLWRLFTLGRFPPFCKTEIAYGFLLLSYALSSFCKGFFSKRKEVNS